MELADAVFQVNSWVRGVWMKATEDPVILLEATKVIREHFGWTYQSARFYRYCWVLAEDIERIKQGETVMLQTGKAGRLIQSWTKRQAFAQEFGRNNRPYQDGWVGCVVGCTFGSNVPLLNFTELRIEGKKYNKGRRRDDNYLFLDALNLYPEEREWLLHCPPLVRAEYLKYDKNNDNPRLPSIEKDDWEQIPKKKLTGADLMLNSKLLKKAAFDYDMTEPDGTHKIGFTLESGVQEIPNWEVTLVNKPEEGRGVSKWVMTVESSEGAFTETYPGIVYAQRGLTQAVQLLRDDFLRFPKFKSRIEVLMVKIHKQVEAAFEQIA
jgi:hypothetical protein